MFRCIVYLSVPRGAGCFVYAAGGEQAGGVWSKASDNDREGAAVLL